MTTQISTKLAALAVALLINGLMFSSVAYLFNGQLHAAGSLTWEVHNPVHYAALAKI